MCCFSDRALPYAPSVPGLTPLTAPQLLFTHYVERHRNLEYLEAQLSSYRAAEAEALEGRQKRLRKMQKKLACVARACALAHGP